MEQLPTPPLLVELEPGAFHSIGVIKDLGLCLSSFRTCRRRSVVG
jgi:hypothetical protein